MFNKLKVFYRLVVIFLLIIIVSLGTFAFVVKSEYSSVYDERKACVEQISNIAINIIKNYDNLAKQGKISLEEAKKLAVSNIDLMKFEGRNYFWIYDLDGTLILHPLRQERVGQNINDLKDVEGNPLYPRFINKIKEEGSGYTTYTISFPSLPDPIKKIAYSVKYEPWDWGISTAIFYDNIEAAKHKKYTELLIIYIFSTIASLILVSIVCKTIIKPILDLSNKMKEVANGNLDIEIKKDNNKTEIAILNNAFIDSVKGIKKIKKMQEEQDKYYAEREAMQQEMEILNAENENERKEKIKLAEDAKMQIEEAKKKSLITYAEDFDKKISKIVNYFTSTSQYIYKSSARLLDISNKILANSSEKSQLSKEIIFDIQTITDTTKHLSDSIAEVSKQSESMKKEIDVFFSEVKEKNKLL